MFIYNSTHLDYVSFGNNKRLFYILKVPNSMDIAQIVKPNNVLFRGYYRSFARFMIHRIFLKNGKSLFAYYASNLEISHYTSNIKSSINSLTKALNIDNFNIVFEDKSPEFYTPVEEPIIDMIDILRRFNSSFITGSISHTAITNPINIQYMIRDKLLSTVINNFNNIAVKKGKKTYFNVYLIGINKLRDLLMNFISMDKSSQYYIINQLIPYYESSEENDGKI